MRSPIAFVLCAVLAVPAFAFQVEAMKHGNQQAEAAAQARVEARAKIPPVLAIQPEAQRAFNPQAVAVAESRKARRLQTAGHPADQARMVLQYQAL